MAGLAVLSLVVGALAAVRLPLVPFAVLLVGTSAVGTILGLALLTDAPRVILGALLLFASTQVGYGIGLGLVGLHRGSRRALSRRRRKNGEA